MDTQSRIAYHLREWDMARDPTLPGFVAPPFGASDRAILDIGCGIGQTFLAGAPPPDATLVGVDVDADVLKYGSSRFHHIAYVCAPAEDLPFADGSFDRVISRVSLPYTDLARATREMGRVLRDGGTAWMSLHAFPNAWRHLGASIFRGRAKDALLRMYVLANGVLLHCSGKVLRLPMRDYCESCQSERAIVRALRAGGFENVIVRKEHQFIVTATRSRR